MVIAPNVPLTGGTHFAVGRHVVGQTSVVLSSRQGRVKTFDVELNKHRRVIAECMETRAPHAHVALP